MDRTNYFKNQKLVTADDLNNTEATKASQSVLRTQAPLSDSSGVGGGSGVYAYRTGSVTRGGVYGSPADYLNTLSNLYVNFDSETQLTIASGTALDIKGNLIVLSTPKTIIKGGSDINYSWVSYPSVMNYVKAYYVEQSGSMVEDVYGNSLPTRYTGSYYLQTDNSVPGESDILLATFVANSTGGVPSISDRRLYVTTIIPGDAVILDPVSGPVSSHVVFQDHVDAVGSGTPSSTNPHGLLYSDVGAASEGSDVTNLSFSIVSTYPSIVEETVYQNASSSLMALFTICSMSVHGVDETVETVRFDLQAGSAGTVGPTGSITSPIILDTVELKIDTNTDGMSSGSIAHTLMGFVPSLWYYQLTQTLGPDSSGSVIGTTYFL